MPETTTTCLGRGGADIEIGADEQRCVMGELLESQIGPLNRILVLAPDITRLHSGAGALTSMLYELVGNRIRVDVLPTLGSHVPMTRAEIDRMYPGVPHERFLVHNWRTEVRSLGRIPGDRVAELSEGKLDYDISVEVNRRVVSGEYDLIVSIGQVVPHEVAGMANHNKNVLVGAGGKDMLDKTHFLGAVHGMERMMGRAETPVRAVFDMAEEQYLANFPVVYVQTVIGRGAGGGLVMRGVFVGSGKEPFSRAAALAQQCNLDLLDEPIRKAIVWLDPEEFKSTWLGNKAIYRLRMAMADDGELIVLAPGLERFGEDAGVDALIRKYGYRGTPYVLEEVKSHDDLAGSLSAAAHLIHGSSEGRFNITYAPRNVSRDKIEGVGFNYGVLDKLFSEYNVESLRNGFNEVNGESILYVDNPALGLWALKRQFA